MKYLSSAIACLLALCWATSLVLPVAFTNEPQATPGWVVLLAGWLGPFDGQLGWFANPVFAFALILVSGGARAARLNWATAAVLLLLTLSALGWRRLYLDNGAIPIHAFGAGYYIWFVAMFGAVSAMACNALQAEEDGPEVGKLDA